MLLFPNCKINLGLNVVRKRNDGFHDIETVFYPLNICDAVEVIEAPDLESSIQFSQSGLSIDGNQEQNLCLKAYQLLKNDFPQLPANKMHLHKTIPTGAGLGGGSADGAFTLRLLNQKFNLGLSTEKLIDYALQIGSDCPFFIINKPCFATGRGEFLEPIALDLSAYRILIVNPGIHISTAEAFSLINPTTPSKSIKKICQQSIESWKKELRNDFEEPVSKKHPEIRNIRDQLYNGGAIYSSMTGSGSTVFGLFEKTASIQFAFPSNYFVRNIQA